ncbi:MAG TPA: IPT/TIG domain-containing protein, partial [Solirubrobacterales bacterium]|nr:IPT/TIG domain-containing protein [Solirubrobacterales bacterium]
MNTKKALPSESNNRQATGFGRVFRGVFATRGASPRAKGSGAPSGRLPLGALSALVAVFLLLPAAQAFAAHGDAHGNATVEIVGSGEAEVSSVGGLSGFYEGNPPIECHGVEPGEGECGPVEMEEAAIEAGKDGIALHVIPATGSEFVEWIVEEGENGLGCLNPSEKKCLATNAVGSDVEVLAIVQAIPAPVVSAISPTEGPAAGGNTVTISGEHLQNAEKVEFGSEEATIVNNEETEIEVEAPAGTGTVAVSVTTPGGTSAANPPADEYTYEAGVPTHTLTINTTGTGTGQVDCKVNGGSTDEPCQASYPEGTELELIAVEGAHSQFTGFEGGTGDASGCTTSPCTFTLEGDSELDAGFDAIQRSLTVNTGAGTGTGQVNCKVNGGSTDEPCGSTYTDGTELELIPDPASGSEFAGFAGGSGSAAACTGTSPCTFTIEADSEVDAPFDETVTPEYPLATATFGSGSGAISCDTGSGPEPCAAEYPEGTEVTLTANPASGSEFVEWGGDCSGAGSCEVAMGGPHSVSARFDAEPTPPPPTPEYDLTIHKVGPGSGSVFCDGGSCDSSYPEGATVSLTATPGSGSVFYGWAGAGCHGAGSCVVTLDRDTTVTAAFELAPSGGQSGGEGEEVRRCAPLARRLRTLAHRNRAMRHRARALARRGHRAPNPRQSRALRRRAH